MRTMMIGLFLLAAIKPCYADAAPFHRPELEAASDVFCNESNADLAGIGIYDAQLEVAIVKADDLKTFAKGFAETNGHHGYSYGLCRDKRQWIVSTPSPSAVLRREDPKKRVHIRREALVKICDSYDVDAIEEGSAQPLSLLRDQEPSKGQTILALNDKSYRTLTLTCRPHDMAATGPQLWALIPFLPQEPVKGVGSEAELLLWIQDQRKKIGIPRLEQPLPALQDLADESAIGKDLHHPHGLLLSKKKQLKSQNIELLGENRAVATSFSGLAQLLWNSPTHRRLILNPKANAIALNTSQKGEEKLLVMVLAKK